MLSAVTDFVDVASVVSTEFRSELISAAAGLRLDIEEVADGPVVFIIRYFVLLTKPTSFPLNDTCLPDGSPLNCVD